ncbi:MAG: APC family permease [Solobacterium sp.]|nr:APC family permease [Solobacterium sp.]
MSEEKGKKVGLVNLIGMGLGGAIGTGIFVMLGYGIAFTGNSIVPVVMIGCFYMLLAYWYQLCMPSIFVLKGGDYSMKQLLFTPLLTGVSAWFLVFTSMALSNYALVLSDYVIMLAPGLAAARTILAVVIMTLFFVSSIKGSRFMVLLENYVTWLLLAAIAIFVFFGVPRVNAGAFFSGGETGKFFLNGLSGFFSAIAIMGFACQGTTGAINFSPVTDNPKRTIPSAIIWTNVFLAIIYGLMAYVGAGVLPMEQTAGANISVTAEAILPHGLFLFFVIGGGIGAIASSALGMVGGMRYPLLSIAEDGWLPAVFKKKTESGYPYVIYAVYYIIAVLPIVTGMGIDTIVSLMMVPTMLLNMYLNYACIKLPEQFPEQWEKRSIRMSKMFYKICCVLGILAAGLVAGYLLKDMSLRDNIITIVMVAFLFIMSWLRMKQGAVSQEMLKERRDTVVQEALATE